MNKENILRVAAAIETATLPNFGFNMNYLEISTANQVMPEEAKELNVLDHQPCGTIACIAGWTCAIFAPGAPPSYQEAAEWLGLPPWAYGVGPTYSLFFARGITDLESITPQHAVRVLRYLAETGEVDWNI